MDPTPGVVLPPVLLPKVKPVAGAAEVVGAGDPNLNPPPGAGFEAIAGAPNEKLGVEVDGAALEAGGAPKVNGLPPLVEGAEEDGVDEPKVKEGAGAGADFAGESSIISPPPFPALGLGWGLGCVPKPPNPLPALLLPKPVLLGVVAAGVPKVNPPPLGFSAAGAAAGAPKVKLLVGVVAPDPAAEVEPDAGASAGFGAPKVNVDAGFDAPSADGVLLPKLNPVEAFGASAVEAGLGAPKVNPPEAGVAVVLVLSAGLPKVNPEAAGVEESPPFAPKKFGTPPLLDSSFFSAGVPKLNPPLVEEAGSAGLAELERKEKLGMLFFVTCSSSVSAERLAVVKAALEGGAPKVNPPAPELAFDALPKKEDLPADVGAGSSFFLSAASAGFAPNDPKVLLLALVVVEGASVAGLGAPKLKAGLSPAAADVDGAPNENPPLAAGAAAGAGAAASNFFIVLPKKLGTGPSFFPSSFDFDAGSEGLLKKSDAGGAAVGFLEAPVLSSLAGAAGAPKLNLGMLEGAFLVGAAKVKEGAAGLGASAFSGAEESKPPMRPNKLPLEAGAGAGAPEVESSFFSTGASDLAGAAAELLPAKENPEGNMFVGNLIFANSVASGRSSSSSSSHALNLPEL